MTQDAFSPARMADRAQIQEVMFRYCHAIDRQQLEMLATDVFHADATTDNGHYKGDIPGFIAKVRVRHATIPQAFHMIGNVLIDFLGPDRAFVESYCLAMEHHPQDPAGPVHRIVRVRYADIFERRNGLWRVAERTVISDHDMGVPAAACAAPLFGPDVPITRGVRNASDPAVQQRKALGLAG